MQAGLWQLRLELMQISGMQVNGSKGRWLGPGAGRDFFFRVKEPVSNQLSCLEKVKPETTCNLA